MHSELTRQTRLCSLLWYAPVEPFGAGSDLSHRRGMDAFARDYIHLRDSGGHLGPVEDDGGNVCISFYTLSRSYVSDVSIPMY